MIDQICNELAGEIKKEFASVPYPGDDAENVGNWWEIRRFLGKKRQEISLEDINANWGIHHFTSKGLAYYLPAYLAAMLLHSEQIDGLAREAVLKVLSPSKDMDWKTQKIPFSTELNSNQIRCIRRFLEVFGQIYPVWIKNWDFEEILQRGLEYWRHLDESM